MGLRYRKTISLGKGVRLNFGKTGVSISAGVPGFRKTIHSSGRVTTSVGIPGTGLYYVDTDHIGKRKKQPKNKPVYNPSPAPSKPARTHTPVSPKPPVWEPPVVESEGTIIAPNTKPLLTTVDDQQHSKDAETHINGSTELQMASAASQPVPESLPVSSCKELFENCDLPVCWIDILTHREPTSDDFTSETWHYLHSKAVSVFEGDVATMMEIIETVNPFEDLHLYASDFSVEMEQPTCLEIEFSVNSNIATDLQDAVCSVVIRAARDAFALLPLDDVVVHAVQNSKTILSVHCSRAAFASIQFGGKAPSDLIEEFSGNMKFSSLLGFREVNRIKL